MLGADTTLVCSHMARLVVGRATLSLGMMRTLESFPWRVLRYSVDLMSKTKPKSNSK
jgi:hypothetical protein